jgi:predicted lipoprotein with Yx(FWY)xxD motif
VGVAAAGLALGGLTLAGCGTSGGTSNGAGSGAGGNGATVSTANVRGVGNALVDSAGHTLYFADQESGGTIRCVDSCLQFWIPLTVSGNAKPTAGDGVGATLSTLKRPDGSMQVTFGGKPLYTFVEDGGAGKSAGNGFKDSFGGTDFQWHAATTTGAAPMSSTAPGGGGYGGDGGY